MDPVSQVPNPPPAPAPTSPPPVLPPPKFSWTIVLIGMIGLLTILLGVSFYQVLSLQQQVTKLKTTASQPTPTPVSTGSSVPTGSGIVVPAPTGDTNKPIEITGIIKFSNIEGGCWSIEPVQAECSGDKCPLSERPMAQLPNYEIINIPTALKKDGIKANFKLEVQSGVATTCQLGPAVKILDYQIIK